MQLLKIGKVKEINATDALVKATDQETLKDSPWLAVLQLRSGNINIFQLPKVGDYVLYSEYSDDAGFCLGRYLTKSETKAGTENQFAFVVDANNKLVIDAANSKIQVYGSTVELGGTPNDYLVSYNELKTLLESLLDGIAALTVTCPSGGGPSSVPINVATFTTLKTTVSTIQNTAIRQKK